MRQIDLTFRGLQPALWISASDAEAVEHIFDVRFGKSDVLNVRAEMKQCVVQIISRGTDRKLLDRLVEPDAREMIHAGTRLIVELPPPDQGQRWHFDR